MQPITIAGLVLCLGVLARRAYLARNKPRSGAKKRFRTFHLLWGAIAVWLLISFQLQHLNSEITGEPATQSTWERIVQKLSDWGL